MQFAELICPGCLCVESEPTAAGDACVCDERLVGAREAMNVYKLCKELDIEMDGVKVPARAAAILNGIRRELNNAEE